MRGEKNGVFFLYVALSRCYGLSCQLYILICRVRKAHSNEIIFKKFY